MKSINIEGVGAWLLTSCKELKRWQIVTLAVVGLGAAWATYGIYANTTSADQVDLAGAQHIIPVQYGNLVNQVSTNGSLTFPNRETLSFESSGTVAKLLVKEGQQVSQGQLLAELDPSAIILLEEAVAQARIDLQDAKNSLAQFDLDQALELATAEEQVASAEFDLQTALNEFAAAKKPTKLLAQEEVVANARLDLQTAQANLIDLKPSYAQQLAEALRIKAEAELTLKEATLAFNNYQPNLALRLAQARQTKANADDSLEEAQTAWDQYKDQNSGWLEPILQEKEVAQEKLAVSQKELDRLISVQKESQANFGNFIKQSAEFVEIRTATLQSLEARTAEAANLEAQLEVAQGEALHAKLDLEALQNGSNEADRLEVEAQMNLAEADLALAVKSLANLQIGVDPLEAALRQTQVALSQANLEQAEADLAEMRAGSDLLEVTLREKQVAVAESTLAIAQMELALLSQDPDQLDLALRQSQVTSAEQSLTDNLQKLDLASLKSPVAGLVTLVDVDEGDEVSANTTIVEIVDTTVMEINGIVDEIDILMVTEGISTDVTLDAVPGQIFEGVVSEISPAASNQQGVVTYPITIQVTMPENMQLREGLTAVAKIILNEESNVLLVPQQSLYGSFDQPTVKVMTDSGIKEVPVELGNSDDFWVAVRQGVKEGDSVLMEAAEVNTTGSGFRQLRTIGGGSSRGNSFRVGQ